MDALLTFYEFFAGAGMARAGLGEGWSCRFANDNNPIKCATYAANWGADHLVAGDIANISLDQLPQQVDLAWASFPCQDLSLAGGYAGLGRSGDNRRTRSGTFWLFSDKMRGLRSLGRPPRIVVLENVYGTLTSNGGSDFVAIVKVINDLGYRLGAMIIDARWFVPQSRPRLFIVAVCDHLPIPNDLLLDRPSTWHPTPLVEAHRRLKVSSRERWVWWNLPLPARPTLRFSDLIEENPTGVEWHSASQTRYILSLMSMVNISKIETAKRAGTRMIGGIYRRTRPTDEGGKAQRAEVRFDDTAGCLRTPSGGSSRQSIVVVEENRVRTRLLSPREAARLMGLPDSFKLPDRYNEAYYVCGDGVVTPVVRHLAASILEPVAFANRQQARIAAE